MSKPDEWICSTVTQKTHLRASRIRADRDTRYGNIYPVKESDDRAKGDLGEICVHTWLTRRTVTHTWIQEEVAGKPDFLLGDDSFDVKTIKTRAAPKEHYGCQISAAHATHAFDWLFFTQYCVPTNTLCLLGAISRERFFQIADWFGSLEYVTPTYQIREGHAIYNTRVRELIGPRRWLDIVTRSGEWEGNRDRARYVCEKTREFITQWDHTAAELNTQEPGLIPGLGAP